MEVRPGYKQTEVGVIPDDWGVLPMLELVTELRGGAALKPSDFTRVGVKILPKGGVGRTGWLSIKDNDLQYCTPSYAAAHRNNQVDRSYTIVVLRDLVPSGPSIGLIVQIKDAETFVLAQGVYGFKTNKITDSRYLIQLSHTRWYRRLMNSIMVGSTQVHITNTAFRSARVPVPALHEQQAIATALSDVDALLAGLDRIITKKRDLKQAAMQQLLTGQTRLPGFQGEWETTTLETATICLDGLRVPLNEAERATMKGDIPYCGANGVLGFVDRYIIDDDIILMAEDGGYFDEFETRPIAYRMAGKCWVNNHAHILKARDGFDQEFIFYSLVHKNILPFLASGTRAKLNKSEMNKIAVSLPKIKLEQSAIATVLSDMDAELTALEARRDKTRALKQGMMQELLTGRTRLV